MFNIYRKINILLMEIVFIEGKSPKCRIVLSIVLLSIDVDFKKNDPQK